MLSEIRSNSVAIGSGMTLSLKTLTEQNPRLAEASVQTPARTEPDCIAVVEDEERVREALAFQLRSAGFQVVPFSSAQDFLAEDKCNFDCLVADIFLPAMNGLELQEQLKNAARFVPVVFITGRGDLAVGVEAMKRGAVDVLEKPVDDETILNAIARGVALSHTERARSTRRVDLEARFKSLPERQRQVFTLITAGLLNKQVAAEMRITERTVKVHRERLRRKMGADSLAELARIAELLQIHSPSRTSTQL
jgi:FixJ family two-component response regulator